MHNKNLHYVTLIDPYICLRDKVDHFNSFDAYKKGLAEDIFIKSTLTGENLVGCG